MLRQIQPFNQLMCEPAGMLRPATQKTSRMLRPATQKTSQMLHAENQPETCRNPTLYQTQELATT
jgi:hypothetical protein